MNSSPGGKLRFRWGAGPAPAKRILVDFLANSLLTGRTAPKYAKSGQVGLNITQCGKLGGKVDNPCGRSAPLLWRPKNYALGSLHKRRRKWMPHGEISGAVSIRLSAKMQECPPPHSAGRRRIYSKAFICGGTTPGVSKWPVPPARRRRPAWARPRVTPAAVAAAK